MTTTFRSPLGQSENPGCNVAVKRSTSRLRKGKLVVREIKPCGRKGEKNDPANLQTQSEAQSCAE
jgi:hypothetical protein